MAVGLQQFDTLPARVAEQLARDIDLNQYAPGERLPGNRQLAELYHIGLSSMITALQILQQKGYVDRVPMRGTFVCRDVKKFARELKILFCMPYAGQNQSPQNLTGMITLSEVMQGLAAECNQQNYTATFRFFSESSDQMVLRRQLELIETQFNAVVFLGYQLHHLQELVFQQQIPAVNILPMPLWGEPFLPFVFYNQEKALEDYAGYISECGYHSMGIFLTSRRHREDQMALDMRILYFKRCLEKFGIQVTEYSFPEDDCLAEEEGTALMTKILEDSENVPDVLCGVSFQMIMFLQKMTARFRLEKRIIALTGNSEFSAFQPAVAFLKVPFEEMGRMAAHLLIEHIRLGKMLRNQEIQPVICS